MLPLRQKTEFGRLREVILGSTEKASFPGASDSNANFTDHIADLGAAFYDKWRDKYPNGEPIPYEVAKPELTEAYNQMHHDLAAAYEREGVKVHRIDPPTKEILSYFGYANYGYWPTTLASLHQIFGNVYVEALVSDNILECGPVGFTYRDLIMERFKNDPDAIWVSLPPAKPIDRMQENGPGPYIAHGCTRLVDDRNILVGIGRQVREGRTDPTATNEVGAEILKRMMRPYGFETHIVNYDAHFSFHFDYILGCVAPGIAVVPEGAFLDGLPEPIKNWNIIWINKKETNQGASNIVPLGPDDSGKHRVLVPEEAPRVIEEIDKLGVRPIPIKANLPARNGGAIRCATLVLNRDD
jgi:N-dimethylarginine dimethylaminohydrolase